MPITTELGLLITNDREVFINKPNLKSWGQGLGDKEYELGHDFA